MNGLCRPLPPNCLLANPNGICTQCRSLYELINGICVRDIPNCSIISQITNLCERCDSGYYVNANGNCAELPPNCFSANVIGSCLQCIADFELQNGICIKVDPNCQTYNPLTGYCLNCLPRFYL